ncbi:MAG: DUF5666 domain-containing protein [Planctomycetes bacterium]|nr:DUF5666 domain-containing protein [Planctomycetota bacterium]
MGTRGFLALAFAGLLVAGCGGGGGTSGQSTSLGSVALMFAEQRTDAEPTSVAALLTEVTLVPRSGGPRVVLFGDPVGQDVDLSREDLLVSVAEGIEPGQYDKVTVALAGVSFQGADCADIEVDLPAGEITVVPDDVLVVSAGGMLSLRLALDVDKSIEHGSSVCTFRPVFQARAGDRYRRSYGDGDCPRTVTGTVEEVSDDATSGVLELGERCDLEFLVDENTAIFDEDGQASDSSEIAVGAELYMKGYLNDDRQFVALVIVVGEVLAVEGKVDAAFDSGIFTLLPDEDEEIVGAVDVTVSDGTLITFDCAEGSTDDIVLGARLVATGKFDTESGTLLAIAVEIGPAELCGQLTAIEETDGGVNITLQVEGEEDPRTIFVGEDVDIHLEGDGSIPSDLLATLLECGPLTAKVLFAADDPTLVVDVSIEESEIDGEVTEIDASSGLMTVDETVVGVLSGATILDLRGDDGLISLSDVAVGDRVRVFGLEACEDEDVDFHGFVVLVLPQKKWDDGKDWDDHDDDGWKGKKGKKHGKN